MRTAHLTDYDTTAEIIHLADGIAALRLRHPVSGLEVTLTRPAAGLTIEDHADPEAAEILRRLDDPGERFYLHCAKAAGRRLLRARGVRPARRWSEMRRQLEGLGRP